MVYRHRKQPALNHRLGAVRALAVIVSWVAVSFLCVASEKSADATGNTPLSSSVAAPLDVAKRQFQSSQQQNKNYPETNSKAESQLTPVFQMPGSDSLYGFLTQRTTLDRKKDRAKGNWLVDGVMGAEVKDKQKAAKTKAKGSQENSIKDEDLSDRNKSETTLEGALDASKSQMSSKEASVASITSQVDPFLPFMEKWMSAKDYDIIVHPSNGQAVGSTELAASLGPVSVEGPRLAFQSDLRHRPEFADPSSGPPGNPFLKAMEAWTPTQAAQSLTSLTSPSANSPAREQIMDVKSQPPKMPPQEFQGLIKPLDDRKYFPQLKRF
jgi:hypothetical protein